tara:strand:- start:4908 stop:6401 length:1494 start_codon:yes stop_codon:yes gene_type:complete
MQEKKISQAQRDLFLMWRRDSQAFIRDHFKVELDFWQKDVCQLWDEGHKRIAMLACKGPGKTALLAMLIWHFLFTRRQSKVACTSVSGDNMRDGLWTELAKWRQLSPWLVASFEWQKERIIAKDKPETHWAAARTWSQSADIRQQANTLAGLHADYILFVIDEAGGVPDSVAVSAEAALASGKESRFLIAGNPTECQGPLWRAAGKDKALWKVISISGDPDDPKRSPRVDKEWARSQIEQHGANNPWVLANVFGKFPPSSPNTFIPRELVEKARKREGTASMYDALVMGVDVARFGDDEAVICFRKGNDAKTHPARKFRNISNMALAAHVADLAIEYGVDAIFVDGGGNGGGVVDRLMQLNIPGVIEVQFGGKSDRVPFQGETAVYDNKAAEMAGKMKKWLEHGAVEDSDELERQLCERRYGHNLRYGRDAIALEPKDDMKKRGLDSPDWFDALSLTFAYPVEKSATAGREAAAYTLPHTVTHDYDPYREMHVREAA